MCEGNVVCIYLRMCKEDRGFLTSVEIGPDPSLFVHRPSPLAVGLINYPAKRHSVVTSTKIFFDLLVRTERVNPCKKSLYIYCVLTPMAYYSYAYLSNSYFVRFHGICVCS